MPVMGGLAFLQKLRQNPLHTGLPIFVLTGKALADEESKILDELASVVILKETAIEQLGDFLGSIFNFTEIEGSEG